MVKLFLLDKSNFSHHLLLFDYSNLLFYYFLYYWCCVDRCLNSLDDLPFLLLLLNICYYILSYLFLV